MSNIKCIHTIVGCDFVSTSSACNCAVIVATANAVAVGIALVTGCADANKPSDGVIDLPTRKRCPKYQEKKKTILLRRENKPTTKIK
jgi:hypothetical protein